jgi:fructan beta-fructosidase
MLRPRYHFTPPRNFLNDPNGLVFFDGEYHLFYQHNPFGETWGHMSWGHAVSRDLLRWEHLPVALAEENGVMMFSGSAVVDWNNTSGFGAQARPPLIAIYTGHSEREQTQNIAYSTDRGRTWTQHAGNPVLAIGSREFRDPKVFWHAPGRQWVMVTVLADQYKVRFDGSPDLRHWTHLSDFGPAGDTGGLWECPDLFPLAIDGHPGASRWALKVDVQKGVGAQCFLGEFDGTRFHWDAARGPAQRMDYGADFYAAQSWSDSPDGRRLWLGWLNHWDYANLIPTSPWRGLFSIPRELSLRRSSAGVGLVQQPIRELQALRRPLYHVAEASVNAVNAALRAKRLGPAFEINVEFVVGAAAEFGLKVRAGGAEQTVIGVDAQRGELYVDRRRSGQSAFAPSFAAVHCAPLALDDGRAALHLFVDECSVEVFANEGQTVISDLIFPDPQSTGLEFFATGDAQVGTLDVWELEVGS